MPLKPVKIKKRLDLIKSNPWSAAKYILQYRKRVPEWEKYIIKDPKAALYYAKYSMPDGKWPELEKLIIHDPELIYDYANNNLRHRWVEAEPNLLKKPHTALSYASDFGIIKWPNLEKEILKHKDKAAAFLYSKFVARRQRVPELEHLFIGDPNYVNSYVYDIIKGPWPEGEETLLQKPDYATRYAIDFKDERWPELEQILKSDHPDLWNRYKEHFKSIYKM